MKTPENDIKTMCQIADKVDGVIWEMVDKHDGKLYHHDLSWWITKLSRDIGDVASLTLMMFDSNRGITSAMIGDALIRLAATASIASADSFAAYKQLSLPAESRER